MTININKNKDTNANVNTDDDKINNNINIKIDLSDLKDKKKKPKKRKTPAKQSIPQQQPQSFSKQANRELNKGLNYIPSSSSLPTIQELTSILKFRPYIESLGTAAPMLPYGSGIPVPSITTGIAPPLTPPPITAAPAPVAPPVVAPSVAAPPVAAPPIAAPSRPPVPSLISPVPPSRRPPITPPAPLIIPPTSLPPITPLPASTVAAPMPPEYREEYIDNLVSDIVKGVSVDEIQIAIDSYNATNPLEPEIKLSDLYRRATSSMTTSISGTSVSMLEMGETGGLTGRSLFSESGESETGGIPITIAPPPPERTREVRRFPIGRTTPLAGAAAPTGTGKSSRAPLTSTPMLTAEQIRKRREARAAAAGGAAAGGAAAGTPAGDI